MGREGEYGGGGVVGWVFGRGGGGGGGGGGFEGGLGEVVEGGGVLRMYNISE